MAEVISPSRKSEILAKIGEAISTGCLSLISGLKDRTRDDSLSPQYVEPVEKMYDASRPEVMIVAAAIYGFDEPTATENAFDHTPEAGRVINALIDHGYKMEKPAGLNE